MGGFGNVGNESSSALRYARYVGRVGALAVSLGVGFAVATSPGVAWADDTPSQSTNPDTGQGADEPEQTPADPGPAEQPTAPETVSQDTDPVDPDQPDAQADDLGDADVAELTDVPDEDLEPVVSDDPEPEVTPQPDPTPDPSEPPSVPATGHTPEPEASPSPDPEPGPANRANARSFAAPEDTGEQPDEPAGPPAAGAQSFTTFDAFDAPAAVPTVAPAAPPDPLTTLLTIPATFISAAVNLVTSLLEPIIGPHAPLDNALLWGVLAWIRRETNRVLANTAPPLAPQQTGQDLDDRQVHGTFGPADVDGDPLTYTVPSTGAGAPQHGTVAIDQAGRSWTYTPEAGYSGTDTFTVTVSDEAGGFHLHAWGQSHTAAAVVTVTVAPPSSGNTAPVADENNPYATDFVDQSNGRVTGHVTVTDPDGDDITYSLKQPIDPAIGIVDVDENTGNWIFTPDPHARQDAYFSPGTDTAGFVVVASDGSLTTEVTVSAVIDTDQNPRVLGTPTTSSGVQWYYQPTVSPDERRAVTITQSSDPDTGAQTSVITVVDTHTGEVVGDPITADGNAHVAFTTDSSHLFVVANGNYAAQQTIITVLDAETGAVVGDPLTIDNQYSYVSFSEDGRRAFVTTEDRDYNNPDAAFAVFDTATGELLGEPVVVAAPTYASVQFSDDGSRALMRTTKDDTQTITIIDTETGAVVGTVSGPGYGFGDVFALADGTRIYVNDLDSLTIIDTATGLPAAQPIYYDGARLQAFENGPRVSLWITAADGSVRYAMIDPTSDTLLGAPTALEGTDPWIPHSDAEHVFVTTTDGTGGQLYIFDVADGQQVGQAIAFSGGDPRVATADAARAYLVSSDDQIVIYQLFNPQTGAVVAPPITLDGDAWDFRSTDGGFDLLSAIDYQSEGVSTTVVVVDRQTGAAVAGPVTVTGYGSLSQVTTNRYLVVSQSEGSLTVALFDTATGALLGQPVSVSFGTWFDVTSDGSLLYFIGGDDQQTSVTLVDIGTGAVAGGAPVGLDGERRSVTFNGDHSLAFVVTELVGDDDTRTYVNVIDTATGGLLGGAPTDIQGAVVTPSLATSGDFFAVLTTVPTGASPFIRATVFDSETGAVINDVLVAGDAVSGGGVLALGGHPVLVVYDTSTPGAFSTTVAVLDTSAPPVTVPGMLFGVSAAGGSLLLTTTDQLNSSGHSYVSEIDLITGQLVGEVVEVTGIVTGSTTGGTWKSPDGSLTYTSQLARAADGTLATRVTVVDAAASSSTVVEMPGIPQGTARLTADKTRAVLRSLVTAADGSETTMLAVIDTENGTLVGDLITLPGRPNQNYYTYVDIAFSADGSRGYQTTTVTAADGSVRTTFSAIDLDAGAVLGDTIDVPGELAYRTYSTDGTRVYVTTGTYDDTTGTSTVTFTVIATGQEAPALVNV